MIRRLALAATVLGLLAGAAGQVRPGVVTWSTGDLGNNVIDDGGTFTVNPDLVNPSNVELASLVVKYGLWNSPNVPVDVSFNGTSVGSFVADLGYISPGPQFATFDLSGLLLGGLNTVLFTGSGSGDYVIGQVDVTYYSVVPEPS